jgi:hypothetical protein
MTPTITTTLSKESGGSESEDSGNGDGGDENAQFGN